MKKRNAIRSNAQALSIENEGRLVYLYDPANAARILALVPEEDAYPLDEQNLAAAVREGLIVLYELYQDDRVEVDVVAGKPLNAREKKAVPWQATQEAWLQLPSGVMRVDSANSLLLIPEEADAQGGEVKVPKGDYKLSLDRVQWEELADDSGYDGPGEVVALAKVSKGAFKKNATALLPYQPADIAREDLQDPAQPEAPACPRGKLVDGQFAGHVMFGEEQDFIVNIDPKTAKKLKLKSGDKFEVRIDRLGMVVEAVLDAHTYFDLSREEMKSMGPELATALWYTDFWYGEMREVLRFSRDKITRRIKKTERDQWFPAILIAGT